jgi:hypothetical protein
MYWLAATRLVAMHPAPVPQMDVASVFGFVFAVFTLALFVHQRESRAVVLALAVCLAAMAVYAFLEQVWPLGLVVIAWSAATFHRWRTHQVKRSVFRFGTAPGGQWSAETRLSRMFGNDSRN